MFALVVNSIKFPGLCGELLLTKENAFPEVATFKAGEVTLATVATVALVKLIVFEGGDVAKLISKWALSFLLSETFGKLVILRKRLKASFP